MIVTVVIERAKHEHAKTNSLPRRDFSFLGKKKRFYAKKYLHNNFQYFQTYLFQNIQIIRLNKKNQRVTSKIN